MPQTPLPPEQKAAPADGTRRRKPAIRTMRSDIEMILKKENISMTDAISAEARRAAYTPLPPKTGPKKSMPRAAYALAILLILVGGGIGVFVYLRYAEPPPNTARVIAPPPEPLFSIERKNEVLAKEGTGVVRRIREIAAQSERPGTMVRLIPGIEDDAGRRYTSFTDIMGFFNIKIPETLLTAIEPEHVMMFAYYREGYTSIGIAVATRDPDRALAATIYWEPDMPGAFTRFLGAGVEAAPSKFDDRSYRNIDWRFAPFSKRQDLGIAYTVFHTKNILLIATGEEALKNAMDRIFNVPR